MNDIPAKSGCEVQDGTPLCGHGVRQKSTTTADLINPDGAELGDQTRAFMISDEQHLT